MGTVLCCPVCGARLTEDVARMVCRLGHSFDKAKEGYVNLLTGSRPGDAIGDNKEMAKARHAFLESGAYACLREGLQDTLSRLMSEGGRLCDAGCGDGYYTHGLPENIEVYGFDISKNMLRYAGKRRNRETLFAASVNHIPLADESFDGLLHVFAPFCEGEFARILKDGGFLLSVSAGARHLWGLKKVLYDRPYENDEADLPAPSFACIQQFHIGGEITLTGQDTIQALFAMTPYCYRTPGEGKERLFALETLTTELDFLVRVYRKKEG